MTTLAPPRLFQSELLTVAAKPGKLKQLLQCVLVVLLMIPLLELVFWIGGVGEQEFLRRDDVVGYVPVGGKQMTWRKEGFAHIKLNSFGMNDVERSKAKPPGVFRIAVIGDSNVESLQVERKDNFCTLLEQRLSSESNKKVEVLNFGVSSYNLGQMLLRLKTLALDFAPDMVLFVVRQDATHHLPPNPAGGFFYARPSFFIDSQGRLITDYTVQDLFQRSADGKRMRLTSWLRENTRSWGVVSICVEETMAWWRLFSTQKLHVSPKVSRKHTAFEVRDANVVGTTRPDEQPLTPREDECAVALWPIADAIIAEAKNQCTARGAQLCVVRLTGVRGYDNETESDLMKKTTKRLKVPYFDSTPSMAKAYEASKDSHIWYDTHLTPVGHATFAEQLAPFIGKAIETIQ